MLDSRIASLEEIIYGDVFLKEMERFLPQDIYDATLATEKFKAYMLSTLKSILTEAKRGLVSTDSKEPEFPM